MGGFFVASADRYDGGMRIFVFIISFALLALVGYLAAFYTLSPDFAAKAVAGPGGWAVELNPNFVVNSIRSIRISQGDTVLVTRKGVFTGLQVIALPLTALAGSTIVVECQLQYDRIAPSITSVRHQVDLR